MKLLVLGLLFCVNGFSAEDPKSGMHLVANEITQLQKYLLSDASFSAPADEGKIKNSLHSLTSHLNDLKAAFKNDPALEVNLNLLQQHLTDATKTFEQDNKAFARYMVQSSLQMCINCHTRKQATDFTWMEEDKSLPAMDRADYLFATRQFKKGKAVYEEVVEKFPKNNVGQWNLKKALLSLAIYYAKVDENPKAGAEYFNKVAKKKDSIPAYVIEEVKSWATEFEAWSKEKNELPPNADQTQILAKAKKLLRQDDFTYFSDRAFHVRRLRASSLFHRVLESPGEKSPQKAEALLYLGQIYPRISSNFFFRFGEMYLKVCITQYPKTATARSCYVSLESLVAEGFSGSGGTNIPTEDEVELVRLKRLAY